MPFWLHEHRVLSTLRAVPATHKILYFLVCLICSLTLWFLLFYAPLQRQLNQKKKELKTLEQQKRTDEVAVAGYANAYEQYQKLFDQKTSFLSSQSHAQLLSFFHAFLQQHNVTCCSLVPGEVCTTPVHSIKTLKLVASGDFSDMQAVLEQLGTYERCISFVSVDMTPQEDNGVRLETIFTVKQFKKEFVDHA